MVRLEGVALTAGGTVGEFDTPFLGKVLCEVEGVPGFWCESARLRVNDEMEQQVLVADRPFELHLGTAVQACEVFDLGMEFRGRLSEFLDETRGNRAISNRLHAQLFLRLA